ncbi:MAG: ParB N-terminal domain-containing protein [Pseudomonadota bacterium]
MSRRKLFDIDLPPEDAAPAPAPQGQGAPETKSGAKSGGPGRGPMASAVRDTARSLRERAEIEAGVRAENDALAAELVRLRAEGLAVERLPLDLIDTSKLVRDRRMDAAPQVEDLKRSLLDVGLSNPIRVERAGERYELIQGWRRLQAFRALLEETGEPDWAAIPAAVEAEGGDLDTAYRRMVDENLVREDISFAEMAELARRYADDPRTEAESADEAVSVLYLSASSQKRSYIRAFAQLLEAAGGALKFPEALPRSLGLELRRVLSETGEEGAETLRQGLAMVPSRGPEQELEILRTFLRIAERSDAVLDPEDGAPAAAGGGDSNEDLSAMLAIVRGEPTSSPPSTAPSGPGAPRTSAGGQGAGASASVSSEEGPLEVRVSLAGIAGMDGRSDVLRCTLREGRVKLTGPAVAPELDEDRLRRAVQAFYKTLLE